MKPMRTYDLLLTVFLLIAAPLALAEVVNINKADNAAMQEYLLGIGPVKSQAIVDYRKQSGPFKSINDLLEVPGIGPATLDKIRGNLSTTRGVTRASGGGKLQGTGNDANAVSEKTKGAEKTGGKVVKEAKESAASDNGKAPSRKGTAEKATPSTAKKADRDEKATSAAATKSSKKDTGVAAAGADAKVARPTSKGSQKSSGKVSKKDTQKSSAKKSKKPSSKGTNKTTKSSTKDSATRARK